MSLDALARAVADAAAYLSRMPTTPAPLERTDRAPWVWVTAQARRAQVDPRALAAALRSDDRIDAVATRPDGLLEVTVTPNFVAAGLRDLASGSGMPSAPLPLVPAGPEGDAFRLAVSRFEDWLGKSGWQVTVTVMRELADDGDLDLVVFITEDVWSGETPHGVGRPRHLYDITADAQDLFPSNYDGLATGLLAVATAYLAWEQRCPVTPTRPGEVTTARHLARQLVSRAGRSVLERGMAVLGVSAPARM